MEGIGAVPKKGHGSVSWHHVTGLYCRVCLFLSKEFAMAEKPLDATDQLRVSFNEQGLVPAIVQDADSGTILMVGWMNAEALRLTLQTRKATFYSRSRNKMWVKGESSGHIQQVVEARIDCDQDVILLRCKSHGPCCHAGYQSCFYRTIEDDKLRFTDERVFDPNAVYGKS